MHLEVISHHPKANPRPTPLLFVHGACCSAWVWQNFLHYFFENGYEVHALSLRGHGKSEGCEGIRFFRMAEYLEDVSSVARGLRSSPVIIGHSMGGYVVQKYLERHSAKAAILMASAPVSGFFRMLARLAVRHPWQSLIMHLTWTPFAVFGTPELAREAFFSKDLSDELLARYFASLQHESYYVGMEGTLWNLPRPERVKPMPMLVLGAANDALFSCSEIEATARAYRTKAEIFPDMAHAMMLEPDWKKVADRMLSWLKEQNL